MLLVGYSAKLIRERFAYEGAHAPLTQVVVYSKFLQRFDHFVFFFRCQSVFPTERPRFDEAAY